MKENIKYFRKFLRESSNSSLSFNGGDYTVWVVVEVNERGDTVRGRYNTTADFEFCYGCGRFMSLANNYDCEYYSGPLYDGGHEWEEAEVSSPHLLLPV